MFPGFTNPVRINLYVYLLDRTAPLCTWSSCMNMQNQLPPILKLYGIKREDMRSEENRSEDLLDSLVTDPGSGPRSRFASVKN